MTPSYSDRPIPGRAADRSPTVATARAGGALASGAPIEVRSTLSRAAAGVVWAPAAPIPEAAHSLAANSAAGGL